MSSRERSFFAKLGASVIRHRWAFLAVWTALAALAYLGAGKAPSRLYSGSGDIAGGKALRADSLWRKDF